MDVVTREPAKVVLEETSADLKRRSWALEPYWKRCMTLPHPIVFLVDVDNTLLDNDRIQRDMKTIWSGPSALLPVSATGGSTRICSRRSAIATISAPCSATGPNTRTR